jgi:hypothetical protein
MPLHTFLDFIVFGRISRQTIVNLNQKVYERIPGGPALYSAAGIRCWAERIGIVSEVTPSEQIDLFPVLDLHRIDHKSVLVTPDASVEDQFLGYVSPDAPVSSNPIPFFAAIQKTLPRTLLSESFQKADIPTSKNFYPSMLSEIYMDASCAHICADELHHQLKISTLINKSSVSVLSLLSNKQYMEPGNWDLVMNLMNSLTVFFTSTFQLGLLFKNRLDDIQLMVGTLHRRGCEYVVLLDGVGGYTLFDVKENRKIFVPAYPVKTIDPTGVEEAFCGGFLAGIKKNHDPIHAMMSGSVTASVKLEGSGPFFPLEVTPGLMDARMDRIKDWIKVQILAP